MTPAANARYFKVVTSAKTIEVTIYKSFEKRNMLFLVYILHVVTCKSMSYL